MEPKRYILDPFNIEIESPFGNNFEERLKKKLKKIEKKLALEPERRARKERWRKMNYHKRDLDKEAEKRWVDKNGVGGLEFYREVRRIRKAFRAWVDSNPTYPCRCGCGQMIGAYRNKSGKIKVPRYASSHYTPEGEEKHPMKGKHYPKDGSLGRPGNFTRGKNRRGSRRRKDES